MDIAKLETALINADKAGDAQAATILASKIKELRSAPEEESNPANQFNEKYGLHPFVGVPEEHNALSHGIEQGGAFAFGDEITAGGAATMAKAKSLFTSDDVDWGRAYDEALSVKRGQTKAYAEENPKSALAAELAGAVAVPGRLAASAMARGGNALSRAGKGASLAATQGGIYGAGASDGDMGDRLENAGKTALIAGGIGGAAPVAVTALKPVAERVMRSHATKKMIKEAPSPEALRKEASALFDKADATGGLDRSVLTNAAGPMADKAAREGMDEMLTPQSYRALARVLDEATLPTDKIGFRELDVLRRQAQIPAANKSNLVERNIGSQMVDDIDKAISTASPNAADDVSKARNLWGRMRRTEDINEAIYKGGNYASGEASGITAQFKSILNNKHRRRMFSPDEIKVMEDIVRGGPGLNIMRKLGKMGVGNGQQTNALMSVLSAMVNPALPVVGTVAQKVGEKAVTKKAALAKALAASGGKMPKPQLTHEQAMLLEDAIRRSAGGVEAVR